MKVCVLLACFLLATGIGPSFAQERSQLVIAAFAAPIERIGAPAFIGFGDVHVVISAMRSKIAEPGGLVQNNAITAAADAFVQHWDSVIENELAHNEVSLSEMIDSMVDNSNQTIDGFLTAPLLDPGPSLFLDPEFQVAVAPLAQVGAFSRHDVNGMTRNLIPRLERV